MRHIAASQLWEIHTQLINLCCWILVTQSHNVAMLSSESRKNVEPLFAIMLVHIGNFNEGMVINKNVIVTSTSFPYIQYLQVEGQMPTRRKGIIQTWGKGLIPTSLFLEQLNYLFITLYTIHSSICLYKFNNFINKNLSLIKKAVDSFSPNHWHCG